MSSSTTHLDEISSSQASKEVTANALFDAGSPATLFGRRASTTTGLTWGYYGGAMWVDGVLTAISNGTVALTGSTTNYVETTRAGVVSKNTTAFTAGSIPLYTIVTGASSVTSYTDHRLTNTPLRGRLSKSVAGSSTTTLSAAEARVDSLVFTGALTGNKAVVVPTVPQRWQVYNNTTGAYTLTIKTSAGTGVVMAQGYRTIVECDGTNVVQCVTDTVAIGAQPLDAELSAIAGLTSAADKLPYFTGSGTAATADLTSAGRALIDDADAAAQRSTLGLGTIATQAANNVSITGGSITDITDLAVADGGTGAGTAREAMANLKGIYVLGASGAAVSVSATTSEETLATITVPANAMGANGQVRVTMIWTYTNSANDKTLRLKFGGTTLMNPVVTTSASASVQRGIINRNATNSQITTLNSTSINSLTSTSAALPTSAIDTTAATDVTITGQKASSGETLTLESYLVELIVP